jgi:hypothetical protein
MLSWTEKLNRQMFGERRLLSEEEVSQSPEHADTCLHAGNKRRSDTVYIGCSCGGEA